MELLSIEELQERRSLNQFLYRQTKVSTGFSRWVFTDSVIAHPPW